MRYDVKKILFVGTIGAKDRFFENAQKSSLVQFIDSSSRRGRELDHLVDIYRHAIKVLRRQSVVKQIESDDYHHAEQVANSIVHHDRRIEHLYEELRVLKQEIARIEIFGDFSLDDLKFLKDHGHRILQFFFAKSHVNGEIQDSPELVYIDSNHGLDYYLAINHEPKSYPGLIEMKIEEPLGVLQMKEKRLQDEMASLEHKLKELAKYHDFLHQAAKERLNRTNLVTAKKYPYIELDDQIFAVEGWVAENRLHELHKITHDLEVHEEEIAIEEGDQIPTYLENEGMSRIGEDLVNIYDTPSNTDKDPSPWVIWWFALFFAIILGDGGYGFLLLVAAFWLRMKFPKAEGVGKRMINLATLLAISCVSWGVLTSTYFGIAIPADSSLRNYSLVQYMVEQKAEYHMTVKDDVYEKWIGVDPELAKVTLPTAFIRGASKNGGTPILDTFADNIMLELALFLGTVHIIFSLLRMVKQNWAGAGWIAAMIGTYMYAPGYLNATSLIHFSFGLDKSIGDTVGLDLMMYGFGAAIICSFIQNKIMGLLEIMNLIQIFSDVLSYLRLYALGLAGGLMSATFNQMGMEMPFVLGAIVILIGHMINFTLGIMGGVIHGLRLNFIEWYHYSFQGGGKMFQPLKLFKIK
jgi:V/A-type H+-transporting ATPase subunit I